MDNVNEVFRQNLVRLLKKTGTGQNELAKHIGVTPAAVNNWTRGTNVPRMEKIDKICAYFGVSRNDLVSDSKRKDYRIPILGTVVAGVPMEAIENIDGYIDKTPKMMDDADYFALKIKGQSMEPELHEGDTVIVRVQPEVENGQIAIVTVNGDEATCKQVVRSKDGITLIGYNPVVYPPHFYSADQVNSLPVKVIGRVIEVRRDY